MIEDGSSWSGNERNAAFVNRGDGTFAEAPTTTGLGFNDDGRAAVRVDWDRDGDLDLWLKNRTGPQLRMMRNNLNQPRALQLELQGVESNRDAVGARVTLTTSRGSRLQEIRAGEGYLAQSSRVVHFGLQPNESLESLTIYWPGGTQQAVDAKLLSAGRYRIIEGRAAVRVPGRTASLKGEALIPEPNAPGSRIVLKTPLPLPPELLEAAGFRPSNSPGGALINLWAHWCEPCVEELSEVSSSIDKLDQARLRFLPLNIDALEDRAAAVELFEKLFPTDSAQPLTSSFSSGPELLETVDALLDHVLGEVDSLPVPTSLLVDGSGRLQVLYLGQVFPDSFLADHQLWIIDPPPASQRGAWPGRWYYRTPRNLEKLGDTLRSRGRTEAADFYKKLKSR